MKSPSVRPVTRGPRHHFFGYYDKCPWDLSGRYLLGCEVGFMDRQPMGEDVLVIGLIDLERGCAWEPICETRAWCWQTGCALQWMPGAVGRQILYNDRRGGRFVTVVRDVATGSERVLPRAVLTISRDGSQAIGLNYSRLDDMRAGYGYPGLTDANARVFAPEDDGLWVMDLATGESRLAVSDAQVAAFEPQPTFAGRKHFINHADFNPSGTRLMFLHRWAEADASGRRTGNWGTRFFTANPDGSDLFLFTTDWKVSHYDWRDDATILAWAIIGGRDRFFLFHDRTRRTEVVGEGVLTCDGHCSYSPDRRWILTDTYPDKEHKRTLLLYEVATGWRVDLGRFYSPPELEGPLRCDLHPRWSRDGTRISIDSAHEGSRQIYVLDAAEVVKER